MDDDTGKVVLNQNGDCYSFKGEAKVYTEVSGGASTELNIMINRHYFQHHMQRLNQPLPPLRAHFDLIESDRRSNHCLQRVFYPKTASHFSENALMRLKLLRYFWLQPLPQL